MVMTNSPVNVEYIKTLVAPRGPKSSGKKSWSIDVETDWVPFFISTNVMGYTDIAPDALGAPLRLAHAKDGSIRFSQTGMPVVRVNPELTKAIGSVRENLVASMRLNTQVVKEERPDDFQSAVKAAMDAGIPLIEKDVTELTNYKLAQEQAAADLAAKEATKHTARQAALERRRNSRTQNSNHVPTPALAGAAS